jgi:2-polyprenyl-3-methyl-5-hydroxy-6-metoxy-1,4-benzoquinol methylase
LQGIAAFLHRKVVKLARLLSGRREPEVERGRPEDRWREIIAQRAPGHSFLDVGCMWNVDGAYAFLAADAGAEPVVGVDVAPATPAFQEHNAERGEPVRFVQGDVNDPNLAARVGRFDVVFCSGVLYHMPDPLCSLRRLRALCAETLILTSARIEELTVPQAAVYLPYLDAETRQSLQYWSSHTKLKVGLDTDYEAELGYGNWFWGLTPSAIRAMLRTAGFQIERDLVHRHVYTAVCHAA